jgi:hypothetical protein
LIFAGKNATNGLNADRYAFEVVGGNVSYPIEGFAEGFFEIIDIGR